MNACFSGVSRGTDQGVFPFGTDGDREESCGSPVKVQASARADVPTVPAVRTQGVQRVCKFFVRMLGHVLVRQPTVILRVSAL